MPSTTQLTFRVPLEHHQPTLEELVARSWPEAPDGGLARAFDEGRVRVDDRITHNPDKVIGPGRLVEAHLDLHPEDWGMPEANALARGDGWVVVDKPIGMPGTLNRDNPMDPVLYLADGLGVDRNGFTPAWTMPNHAGGPWLFGLEESQADELIRAWFSGELMTTWVVLCERPDQSNGVLPITEKDVQIRYSASTMRDGLAELQLTPEWKEEPPGEDIAIDAFDLVGVLLDGLAEAGIPALGDRQRGGYMVPGGLRLRLGALYRADSALQHSWQPGDAWWPVDPVVSEPTEEEQAEELELPQLVVSAATIDALRGERPHPWVKADAQTGRRQHLRPGTLVELRGTNDVPGPVALVEGTGQLAARVWSEDALGALHFDEEVDLRVDEALADRAELMAGGGGDFYRLIHGEADGLPGFLLDRIGPVLRARVVGAAAFAFKERIYESLTDFDPKMMILEMEDLPGKDRAGDLGARIVRRGASYLQPGQPVVGWDNDLRWNCDPWRGGRQEVLASRRLHRRKLAEMTGSGQTWLDLASPRAGCALPLAAAGADVHVAGGSEATLEWQRKLFELNGVPRDRWHRGDNPGDYLQGDKRPFDGIVLDLDDHPFPYAPEGFDERLEGAMGRLKEGGWLLVVLHDVEARRYLERAIASAAEARDREVLKVEKAPPPADFPALTGFPEGTPYEARFVQIS